MKEMEEMIAPYQSDVLYLASLVSSVVDSQQRMG